jgi:hypothetical protein
MKAIKAMLIPAVLLAATAILVAEPAGAQSYDPSVGSGNVAPRTAMYWAPYGAPYWAAYPAPYWAPPAYWGAYGRVLPGVYPRYGWRHHYGWRHYW